MSDIFVERTVETSPEAIHDLFSDGRDWLHEALQDASAHGEGADDRLRASFGLGRLHVTVGKRVRVVVGDVRHKGGSVVIPVTWESKGYSGLFPVMQAVIQVSRLDRQHSRIVFWGRYDPPLGRAGEVIDRYVAHQVAEATVQGFVDAVADKLAAGAEPLAG